MSCFAVTYQGAIVVEGHPVNDAVVAAPATSSNVRVEAAVRYPAEEEATVPRAPRLIFPAAVPAHVHPFQGAVLHQLLDSFRFIFSFLSLTSMESYPSLRVPAIFYPTKLCVPTRTSHTGAKHKGVHITGSVNKERGITAYSRKL